MGSEVPVHAADLPPGTVALGEGLATALGGLEVGDLVEGPAGPLVVVQIRQGGDEAWATGGDGSPWTLTASTRASERLRIHRGSAGVPEGGGYHPIHQTPLHGEPLPDSALEWIREKGAQAVLDDVAWRQDHATLASIAHEALDRGERPVGAWRYRAQHPEVGVGPIREGLEALAFVLGLDLRADIDGVRVGLVHRRPVGAWSSGEPTTSAAFRKGDPAPGGLHDPALVGTRGKPRFGHLTLPWRILPTHLAPWVAELVDRAEPDLHQEALEHGVEWLVPELDRALERRVPRPRSLDGEPLQATDFLWSEIPLLPATYRRPMRHEGQRVPHGLDGTMHSAVAAVRRWRKMGELSGRLDAEMRVYVQRAVDSYLSRGPSPDSPEGWGWSVADDLQGALQVDGVMVDWAGRGVAVVEDRDDVVLPEAFRDLMPAGDASVLLVHMPTGVAAARPRWGSGSVIRLPPDIAGSLRAQTGDLVRVLPSVSQEACTELDGLADGVRLSPLPRGTGWLDDVADAAVGQAASVLVRSAMEGRVDVCHGVVGRRVFGGLLPPARGSDQVEVDAVHRGIHLLLRLAEGPGSTLPPGVAAAKLEAVEAALGRRVVPEVRALWAIHDGQMGESTPLLVVDGERWSLLALDPAAVRDGRVPLAVGDGRELLEIDPDGRVWRGEALVSRSLGRLLQVSYLLQRPM